MRCLHHTLYTDCYKQGNHQVQETFTKMLNQYNCLTCFGPIDPSSEAHVLKGDCLHVHLELYPSLKIITYISSHSMMMMYLL
jgi:hypothetical protein